jgi:CheY-like chemotaxis protein
MLHNPTPILVVDDVTDNLFLFQTILESEGYRVDTAEDGLTALNKIRIEPPQLILLDIMMPGLNGYEVTEAVRRDYSQNQMPIVLVTAHDECFQHPYQEMGANDLIRKPVDFDELLTTVALHLSRQVTPNSQYSYL